MTEQSQGYGLLHPRSGLLSAASGDLRNLHRQRQLEIINYQLGHFGPLVTPKTSIETAVSMLPPAGGRLILSEGIWTFRTGVTIEKPVHIYAATPLGTIFSRTGDFNTPMITLTSNFSTVHGIKFIDSDDTNEVSSIKVTADYATVSDCVFENVGTGVLIDGGDWAKVNCCTFQSCSDHGIDITGTSVQNIISNNRFVSCSDVDLNMGASVDYTVIAGNSFATSGGTIVMTGNNNQTAAELESCNAVPSGNITRS